VLSEQPDHLPKWTERFATAARHPLAAVALGFVLTGILATGFSKWIDYRSQQREANSAAHARAVQSVKEITDLLYERRTRGVLLSSAIRRQARESETLARKSAYDDVYVRWNSTLLSNQFRMREISGSIYSEYEGYIDQKLAPLLKSADKCLTDTFDAYLRSTKPGGIAPAAVPSSGPGAPDLANQQLDACKVEMLHDAIERCSYELTGALYRLVATGESPPDVRSKLERNCTVP
jgi:hypothetical protein